MREIIVCAGMRRSASTWSYHVLRALLDMGGFDYEDWGWLPWQHVSEWLQNWTTNRAILKSHVYLPDHVLEMRSLVSMRQVRVLYTHRDLREVAASLIRTGSIMRHEYPNMLSELDVIVRNGIAWGNVPDALSIPYTQIVGQPDLAVRAICAWLGVGLPDSLIDRIVNSHSRAAMRKQQPKKEYDQRTAMWPHHISTRPYPSIHPDMANDIRAHFSDWIVAHADQPV